MINIFKYNRIIISNGENSKIRYYKLLVFNVIIISILYMFQIIFFFIKI